MPNISPRRPVARFCDSLTVVNELSCYNVARVTYCMPEKNAQRHTAPDDIVVDDKLTSYGVAPLVEGSTRDDRLNFNRCVLA